MYKKVRKAIYKCLNINTRDVIGGIKLFDEMHLKIKQIDTQANKILQW